MAYGMLLLSLLLGPPDQARIVMEAARKPPITFSWRAEAGAQTYRLRVATTEDLEHPAIDRTTGQTSETVRGLEAGRYYWSVTVLDAAGNDFSSSKTGSFSLRYQ